MMSKTKNNERRLHLPLRRMKRSTLVRTRETPALHHLLEERKAMMMIKRKMEKRTGNDSSLMKITILSLRVSWHSYSLVLLAIIS
jgi:hypothetical protein